MVETHPLAPIVSKKKVPALIFSLFFQGVFEKDKFLCSWEIKGVGRPHSKGGYTNSLSKQHNRIVKTFERLVLNRGFGVT